MVNSIEFITLLRKSRFSGVTRSKLYLMAATTGEWSHKLSTERAENILRVKAASSILPKVPYNLRRDFNDYFQCFFTFYLSRSPAFPLALRWPRTLSTLALFPGKKQHFTFISFSLWFFSPSLSLSFPWEGKLSQNVAHDTNRDSLLRKSGLFKRNYYEILHLACRKFRKSESWSKINCAWSSCDEKLFLLKLNKIYETQKMKLTKRTGPNKRKNNKRSKREKQTKQQKAEK